jgi:drug/metabolite transporter (DMT)-like permease
MPSTNKNRTLGFASCALASPLWGCEFFSGKIALAEMGVGAMVLYRFLFATLVFIPLLLTHKPGLNRREWSTLLSYAFPVALRWAATVGGCGVIALLVGMLRRSPRSE